MSPERFSKAQSKSRASDMYEYGVTLYEVASHRRAFHGCEAERIMWMVGVEGQRPERPKEGDDFPIGDATWELIQRC